MCVGSPHLTLLKLAATSLSFCLFTGETVPSYRRQRVEDRQLRPQCQRFHLRGDPARDEARQGVAGSVCEGGRLQEPGTRSRAGVNLMETSNFKHTHTAPSCFCRFDCSNLASTMNPSPQL